MSFEFDPRLPAFRADPHAVLRRLREHDPVHRSSVMNAWLLTRYHDVVRAATDARSFSNDTLAVLVGQRAAAMMAGRDQRIGTNLGMADGEVHARLRAAVQPFFSARALERLAAQLQAFIDERLARAAEHGELELVTELSQPLATRAVATLFAIPDADHAALFDWARATVRVTDPLLGREERRANFAKLAALTGYLEQLMAQRQEAPGDDLISRLLALGPEVLSRGEIVATCMSIIGGGIDTVSMAISRGVLALLEHPEQLRALRAAPELTRGAVEELLRFTAPAVFVGRVAVTEVTLHGRTIQPCDAVYYSPAAACRDPEVFADPERLDLGRELPAGASVAFGRGAHFCLGAALARLECRLTYRSIVTRCPRLELQVPVSELRYGDNLISMSLERLPLAV